MSSGQLLQAWPTQCEPLQRLPSPSWLLLLSPDPGRAGCSWARPGKSPGTLVASRPVAGWESPNPGGDAELGPNCDSPKVSGGKG